MCIFFNIFLHILADDMFQIYNVPQLPFLCLTFIQHPANNKINNNYYYYILNASLR